MPPGSLPPLLPRLRLFHLTMCSAPSADEFEPLLYQLQLAEDVSVAGCHRLSGAAMAVALMRLSRRLLSINAKNIGEVCLPSSSCEHESRML